MRNASLLRNDLRVEFTPIARLRARPKNPRSHSQKQIRQIAASIERFGWTNPILISDDGEVVVGKGRLAAAKLLGLTLVPAIPLSHLSSAELRAYAIADNRLAELSGWDRDLLAVELQDLAELNFDLTLTGFEMGEIDILFGEAAAKDPLASEASDAFEEPEPGERPVSVRRDLWRLGDHRVVCGDARSPDCYAALLGRDAVDVVFADPPYNVKIEGNVSGLGKVRHSEFAFASGELDETGFIAFLTEALTLAKAYSRDGAIWFVCMDDGHTYELLTAARQVGVLLKSICVWAKTNGGMGSLYRSQVEFVHVFKNGIAPHINNVQLGRFGRNRTTLWSYPGVNTFRRGRMEDLQVHPTVKPTALVADAIQDVSNRGDLVLDPFLGSGTTVLAAEKTGRRARGIEYEPRYVDCAIRRWQDMTGRQAMLAETGETFESVMERRLEQIPADLSPQSQATSAGTRAPQEAVDDA